MAPRLLVLAAFEIEFRQPRLRLLGGLGGQMAEARQTHEKRHGVAMSADFLIAPSQGENTIDEIQGWHHGAASMQLGKKCPANAHHNDLTHSSKVKRRSGFCYCPLLDFPLTIVPRFFQMVMACLEGLETKLPVTTSTLPVPKTSPRAQET